MLCLFFLRSGVVDLKSERKVALLCMRLRLILSATVEKMGEVGVFVFPHKGGVKSNCFKSLSILKKISTAKEEQGFVTTVTPHFRFSYFNK